MAVLALEIYEIKGFMNRLLKEDAFDAFEVRSVELKGAVRIALDGQTESGWIGWREIRPDVFGLIKGKERPKQLKIVFSADAAWRDAIDPAAAALFLNLHYEGDRVKVTTGCAQKGFSLDRQGEYRWDEAVLQFFARAKIPVTRQL